MKESVLAFPPKPNLGTSPTTPDSSASRICTFLVQVLTGKVDKCHYWSAQSASDRAENLPQAVEAIAWPVLNVETGLRI